MNRRARLACAIGVPAVVTGLALASGIARAETPAQPPTTSTTTTTVVSTTTTVTTTVTSTTSSTTSPPPPTEPARSGTVVVIAGCDGSVAFVEATFRADVDLSNVELELRRMFFTSDPIAVETIGDMAAGSSATARWDTIGGYTYSVDAVAAGEFVHNSIDSMDPCAELPAPPAPPAPTPPGPAPVALPATR